MPEDTPLKLLIVEDDPGIATMLNAFFKSHSVNTQIAVDGKQALILVPTFCPDIIILDIVLPYIDGLSVLNKLRGNNVQIPVILLTDKNSVEEKLCGFEHGADDYVTKPFSPKELWMRVQAILRRSRTTVAAEKLQDFVIGELSINPSTREVRLLHNGKLSLTKTEFDLLYFLSNRRNQAVPHGVILQEVMGYSPTSETKALVIHIANIRKKFTAEHIQSVELLAVPGVGYKIIETEKQL